MELGEQAGYAQIRGRGMDIIRRASCPGAQSGWHGPQRYQPEENPPRFSLQKRPREMAMHAIHITNFQRRDLTKVSQNDLHPKCV